MSVPASEKRRQAVLKAQKSQRWGLLALAVVGVIVAKLVALSLGKGLVFGALVAFLMQWVFTVVSFWHTRPHPKQMMNDMYLAMLARFLVGVVGFLVAFAVLKLNGAGVVIGFLIMQSIIVATLYKIR